MVLDNNQADQLIYKLDCARFIEDVIAPSCNPPMQLKWFHREWIDLFNKNRFVSLLAPRSHGKTQLVGTYIVWKIVTNPKIRILVITINQQMADDIMSFIQRTLEGNEKIKELFGEQRGYSDWSRSIIRVFGAGNQKDPTLKVLGITASMIGGHHDMIILDDIMDSNNSRTEHRREEVIRQFENTIMPMLIPPKGKLLSIATRWHEKDMSAYLQSIPDYASRIYKSIIKYPEENNGVAEVLWPEVFPYEELIKIKERYGSLAFEMQYQNNIVSLADSPIRGEWIDKSLEDYETPEPEYEVYMGVDFASKGEESDYFVIVMIAVKDAKIYVLDALRTKASLFKQFDLIRSFDSKWQPIRIGIEQAAQQKIIVDQLIESTTLPIIPIKSSIVNDRMSRVQRLSVLFETGRIFMNSENEAVRVLSDEARIFPHGSNDDCFKEDTLVKTKEGYKKIKDIEVGDEVLTHIGRYKSVTRTIKKPFKGTFHKRRFLGQLSLELSEDHKIYSASYNYANEDEKKRIWTKRQFTESNNWGSEYRNIIPIEKYQDNKNFTLIEDDFYIKNKNDCTEYKSVVLDKEFAYILGLFLAEGNCSTGKNSIGNLNYVFSFAFNLNETEYINKVINYFNNQNIKATLKYDTEKNCTVVEIHNKLYWYLFKECYNDDKEKQLPYYHHHLGKDLKETITGWLDGDGWELKKYNGYDIYGQSTSKSLALSMRDIALNIGWYAIINKRKVYRYDKRCKDAYTVSIKYERKSQCHIRQISDTEFGGHSSGVEEYPYDGLVYDLTVEDDNSFIADGMVVHNCLDSLSFAIQASQYMDEEKHIDWNLIPDMVSSKKNGETVSTVRKQSYDFCKI